MPPKRAAPVSPQRQITAFFAPKKSKASAASTEDDKNPVVQLGDDKDDKKDDKKDEKQEDKPEDNTKPVPGVTSPSTTSSSSVRPAYTFETLENGLPDDWREALKDEFTKPYWKTLKEKLIKERDEKRQIFPPVNDIFTAFWLCPLDKVRVFICGQDPYHDDNQAMGLAFSVKREIKKLPPSLQNIYKELVTDIDGFKKPVHGDLSKWAEQGVFMLNTVLTVHAHKANSHKDFGWLKFTDAVVKLLFDKINVVWILWGKPAETKASGLLKSKNKDNNHIITSTHPSPLSASTPSSTAVKFFGSKPFSKANAYLVQCGLNPIDWQV